MVGAEGFEPPTLWSQTKCASQTALCPDQNRNDLRMQERRLFGDIRHRIELPIRWTILGDFTVAALFVNTVTPNQQHSTYHCNQSDQQHE